MGCSRLDVILIQEESSAVFDARAVAPQLMPRPTPEIRAERIDAVR
jgi:hypothetical protein